MKKDRMIIIPNRRTVPIALDFDFKKLLNKKIEVDYDGGTDDGVRSEYGILREVYKDYIMIVSENRERYVPRNRIVDIQTSRR